MTGHGPDAETFEKASRADLSQARRHPGHDGLHVRDALRLAADRGRRSSRRSCRHDYYRCWQGLKKHFDPSKP